MTSLAVYLAAAKAAAERHRAHYDRGERESAANLAAWQAWQRQVPLWCVPKIVRRRQIDAVRVERGRYGVRPWPVSLDAERGEDGGSLYDVVAGERSVDVGDIDAMINGLRLTPLERETLNHVVAGLTNSEIAELHGVSLSAVSHRLEKIRRRNQTLAKRFL